MRTMIQDLLIDPGLSVDDAAARHLAPNFRQRVDGQWLTRREFLDGIETLRATARGVEVTVADELRDGDRYAERHRITVTDAAGNRMTREVFVFAVVDSDGRFVSIDEAGVEVAPT